MSGLDKYEKIQDIGKGSFGCVSKIKRKADGKVLVWKELAYAKMSDKEKQMIVSEVNILRELHHPNIVKYYDRIIDRDQAKIYIVMEYCEGGDIATLIKNCKRPQGSTGEKNFLPEDIIWSILSQMLAALGACHNRKEGKILHRDLKPGNIFLDSNKNVKLGDFGLSRMMNQDSVFAYTHVGTPYYMSPEQINDQKYNEKSDIWSTGCIIYEIAALRAPFEATTHYQLAMKIKAGKLDRIPSQYSDELMTVINAMIQQEPDKRPSVDELLSHPQILIRAKESKMKQYRENLKRKEYELQKRAVAIKEKESEIQKKRQELKDKEEKLRLLEKQLDEQEDLFKQQQLPPAGEIPRTLLQQNENFGSENLLVEGSGAKGAAPTSGTLLKQRRGSFKQALEDITAKFDNKHPIM